MTIIRRLLVKENDPTPGVSVATHSREYPRGSRIPAHAHGSHQLVYASRGVMEVSSGQSLWKIPPHFGLWIPARTPHQIRMPEAVSMRTLYLRPARTKLPASCRVLHIGTFLRELIIEIVRVGRLRVHNRIECALRDLLMAELERATPVPTGIMFPADLRARNVAQIVVKDPRCPVSLKSMCASAGVSVRTLERTFRREVGTDFECWRRQVRLMKAIELLVVGCRVKEVAFAVGYQHPGAFVALFRETFGTTPKAWVSALERLS
jgi:AraC-like DNA-binding protein/quercetin dioxygenase-like cupin family protein